MSSSALSDPLVLLRAAHGRTRRHLRTIAVCGRAGPADASPPALLDPRDATPDALQSAIAWLDGPARALRRILEHDLSTALIESMAGSDAVCLKGLTGGLAQDAAGLDRRWRQTIRPALLDPHGPAPGLSAWLADFETYLDCCDEELLPTAARLLDEAALDALARACRDADLAGPGGASG